MFLTRPPLSTRPKPGFTFDLHVLSMPPAFVLSQDQTLRLKPDFRPAIPRTLHKRNVSLMRKCKVRVSRTAACASLP